jgi:hypothetical protein
MADWKTEIDTTDMVLRMWNKSSPESRVVQRATLADPTTDVPALCLLTLTRPLTDMERGGLHGVLVTGSEATDEQTLAAIKSLRSILTDIDVGGGIVPPTQLTALPDKQWNAIAELKLRCDNVPEEPPAE